MNSIWSSNSLLSRIYDYGYTLLLLTPYTLLFEPYPVIYACKNNNYLLLWSLLFLGKSPNSIDQKGNTALSHTVQKKFIECSRLLIQFNCDTNQRCADGFSALHSSIVSGCFDTVRLLTKNGASPFFKGSQGFNPLHTAVAGGRKGLVILLLNEMLENKDLKEINATTDYGQTALHIACHEGHLGCVRLLLQYGCDFSFKDFKSRTAIDLAITRGHIKCVKELLKVGARKSKNLVIESPQMQEEIENWSSVPTLQQLCNLSIRNNFHTRNWNFDPLPNQLKAELPCKNIPQSETLTKPNE